VNVSVKKDINDVYWPADQTIPGASAEDVRLDSFFNFKTEASYGTWSEYGYANGSSANSGSYRHSLSKYAPIGINLDTRALTNTNLASRMGTGSTYFMNTTHNGSSTSTAWYGANMWYALRNRAWYAASSTWQASAPKTPEAYLTTASNLIYGENVIYVGVDYPQDWAKY
jgi:hypothetical protein